MSRYKLQLVVVGGGMVSITIIAVYCYLCFSAVSHPKGGLRFRPIGNRLVRIWRDDSCFFGQLDADGTFIEDVELRIRHYGMWQSVGSKEHKSEEITTVDSEIPCYEYRSGVLVLGYFDGGRRFVPLIGSKVLDFKTYKPGPQALPIYNLPGDFVEPPPPGSLLPPKS
jgi:hypothetical protein